MFLILISVFVLVHGPNGDHVRSYEGQSPETITSLLKAEGKTGKFITKKQYEAYIAEHPVIPISTTDKKAPTGQRPKTQKQ